MSRKSCTLIAHIELFYRNGKIFNSTHYNSNRTSEIKITSNPASAYYSKEGKEMNVPKWNEIDNEVKLWGTGG